MVDLALGSERPASYHEPESRVFRNDIVSGNGVVGQKSLLSVSSIFMGQLKMVFIGQRTCY